MLDTGRCNWIFTHKIPHVYRWRCQRLVGVSFLLRHHRTSLCSHTLSLVTWHCRITRDLADDSFSLRWRSSEKYEESHKWSCLPSYLLALLCGALGEGEGGQETVLHIKKCCRVFVTCQVSEQGLQIMCVPPRLIEGNHFPLFSTGAAVYLHTPAERHTHVTILTTTAFLQQQIYKSTVFMTVLWSAWLSRQWKCCMTARDSSDTSLYVSYGKSLCVQCVTATSCVYMASLPWHRVTWSLFYHVSKRRTNTHMCLQSVSTQIKRCHSTGTFDMTSNDSGYSTRFLSMPSMLPLFYSNIFSLRRTHHQMAFHWRD